MPADEVPNLAEATLLDFVSEIARPLPSPGSGAAGAYALALACACAGKAFILSHRHKGEVALLEASDHAKAIAGDALEGAQRDAEDFRAWLLARGRLSDQQLRRDATSLLCLARELGDLLDRHGSNVIETLSADIGAAKDLMSAFEAIERRNLGELA